jgi:hypothetical protein
MFYGADAEALFQAVEPILAGEAMCTGTTVTIRQADQHRELVLPGRVM